MGKNEKTAINALIDYDVNNTVKTEVGKNKKFLGSKETTKDRYGSMIERQFELERVLRKKKMTFEDLLITLK